MCHRFILINGSEQTRAQCTIEHIYRRVISKSLHSVVRRNLDTVKEELVVGTKN